MKAAGLISGWVIAVGACSAPSASGPPIVIAAPPIATTPATPCRGSQLWHVGASDKRADEEFGEGCDMSHGSVCGSGDPIHVTLEPGGAAIKTVDFAAKVRRWERRGKSALSGCSLKLGGPMAPGHYRVRVELPFDDKLPGTEEYKSRTLDGEVTLVP